MNVDDSSVVTGFLYLTKKIKRKGNMSTTAKEERAKISAKRTELAKTKEFYGAKLEALKNKEYKIRNKSSMRNAFGLGSTDKALNEINELKMVSDEIVKLKQERDKKVGALKNELDELKEKYRKNYEKYKNEEREKRRNLILDAKFFVKSHKFVFIGIVAFVLLIIVVSVNSVKRELEEYDLKNLTIKEACEKARGAGWKVDAVRHIEDYTDKTDCYNDSLTVTSYYYDDYDNEVTIYYGTKKSEEQKKAECESQGNWYRDGQCKSQEDWEIHYQWQNAHAACKKYGSSGYAKTLTDCYVGNDYVGTVDGQPTNNEGESESTPKESEQETSMQSANPKDNGEELPDDVSPYDIKELCERGFETLGYTNANITMTNQYAMGYPPYIYVIVGSLSTKSGWTSSRQQVGTIQCQANWETWSIKSLSINGEQIY